jgi:23S rRNA (pseudouridine1915-N3)-methyltransferase
MNLSIISVGNRLNQWEIDGVNYYTKQINNQLVINFIDIKSQQHPKRSRDEIIKIESDQILQKIPKGSYVVSWDIKGNFIDSTQLSKIFEHTMLNNIKICFVIGGSFGLSNKILKISDKVFSASSFTFPHRLFRIILVEQIYRALSIINKSPYHK